jgi:hypothetical protein
MAIVEIPFVINIVVAIGIVVLAISAAYFGLVKGNKQLDLGDKEDIVLYGKNPKPIYGTKY